MAGAEADYRKLPPEWNGIVPTEAFFEEAVRIVEKSKNYGVTLRAMGGVGIALHSANERNFAQKLGRLVQGEQEYTDLDFAGLMKERKEIERFFSEQLGYPKRRATLSSSASQRQIYYHPDGYFTVDVLLDRLLIANHPIDFRRRLGIDPLTITLSDLLLEKIQMWVSFSEKDLKDCLLLIKAHGVSEEDRDDEVINAKYIAQLLSEDWGFYHTATTNLRNIAALIDDLDSKGQAVNINANLVGSDERVDIKNKVDKLLNAIERHPKSMGWRMRSKIGTTKKWYEDVETQQTVGDFGIWRLKDVNK